MSESVKPRESASSDLVVAETLERQNCESFNVSVADSDEIGLGIVLVPGSNRRQNSSEANNA